MFYIPKFVFYFWLNYLKNNFLSLNLSVFCHFAINPSPYMKKEEEEEAEKKIIAKA